MIHTFWRYVTGHWSGAHGLVWSFWINLVLIRILVFLLQDWVNPAEGHDFQDYWLIVLGFALFFHGVLFAWQTVGVIRASEVHIRGLGAMAPVWGTHLALILAFLWILVYAQKAWLMTVPAPQDPGNPFEAARAASYDIVPSSDGLSLAVTGTLELGITRLLVQQLEAHPDVEQVILNSSGGNIYAARGVSNTIREFGLDTLVTSDCSSACTTAFIGGIRRRLGEDARLGFHQYRVQAGYAVLNADPASEQDRDRAIFRRAGVEGWFIDRMFDSPASDMWFPEVSELMNAHVITSLSP